MPSSAATTFAAREIAFTPMSSAAVWAARPPTTTSAYRIPRCPVRTWSPLGSQLMAQSAVRPARSALRVPSPPSKWFGIASSFTAPLGTRSYFPSSQHAIVMAAVPPFMSAAPWPNSFPSRITPANGSMLHDSDGG